MISSRYRTRRRMSIRGTWPWADSPGQKQEPEAGAEGGRKQAHSGGARVKLARYSQDPRVESAEDRGPHGYRVKLARGYRCAYTGGHIIEELTGWDLAESFKEIEPCDCSICRGVERAFPNT